MCYLTLILPVLIYLKLEVVAENTLNCSNYILWRVSDVSRELHMQEQQLNVFLLPGQNCKTIIYLFCKYSLIFFFSWASYLEKHWWKHNLINFLMVYLVTVANQFTSRSKQRGGWWHWGIPLMHKSNYICF